MNTFKYFLFDLLSTFFFQTFFIDPLLRAKGRASEFVQRIHHNATTGR